MIDYSKEPWKTHSIWTPTLAQIWIETSEGRQICVVSSGNYELDCANAHRIVECVNACRGIDLSKLKEKR